MVRKKQRYRFLRFAGEVLVLGAFFAAVSFRVIDEGVKEEYFSFFCRMWLVCLAAGVCITPRSKYTISTALGILVIPFSVVYLAVDRGELLLVGLIAGGALVIGYTAAVVSLSLPEIRRGHFRRKWASFFRNYLFRSRAIISTVCFAVLIWAGVWNWTQTTAAEADRAQSKAEAALAAVGENSELLAQLQQEQWEGLTEPEQLRVLQQIADAECKYLGIPYRLSVASEEMEQSSVWGYYSDTDRSVHIRRELFTEESAETVLSVLLHEVYHGFEFAVVAVYNTADPAFRGLRFFEDARNYDNEFHHYIDSSADYAGYRNQQVEADSRSYSEWRGQQYRNAIEYLSHR